MLKGFINKSTPENSRAVPGARLSFIIKGEQTNNAFALMEAELHRGGEPPAHVHTHEDESFYILEGSIKYYIGQQELLANPGDFVFLPKGVPHYFEVQSGIVKKLMLVSPAGLGKWFWDNSVPAPDMKPLPLPQEPPPADVTDHYVRSLQAYGIEQV
ncbi:cupin domain-containing protein [Cesiribacter sp. SM1]|uniref:cupin domain-containing protein n=1 Tax=Cesiribacter sp. SM1 TaxID=2861196 RepID=UPI001CD3D901|nr:cupin domain-containing protein [Cesiribacter sp. SM1]